MNFENLDTKVKKKPLQQHKIDKLRNNNNLEMMSPAGGWVDVSLMPEIMVDNAINGGEYHLFRKMKS